MQTNPEFLNPVQGLDHLDQPLLFWLKKQITNELQIDL